MSTVTTRLCQYGHQNCYKHMNQTQVVLTNKQLAAARATAAKKEQNRARCQATIAKIEALWAAGRPPREHVKELGWKGVYEVRRMLQREGREDLAVLFARRKRPAQPRCAAKDCNGPAVWIEDNGLDEDDEPIAHWGYLCSPCQKFEDLAEDLLFLLDPWRGGETELHQVAGRLGYDASLRGLESLRRVLERHGRIDLRDMLHTDLTKPRRGWHMQGTVHTPPSAPHFKNQISNGALVDPIGASNGLEHGLHHFGAFALGRV